WVVEQRLDPTCRDAWSVAGEELLKLLEGSARWPEPIEVIDGFEAPPASLEESPPVPPFPVELLPERLWGYVRQLALALQCPPDFVAVPLLALAGGALGGAVRV